MPIARFEMPDGRIGRFEVPEGTTQAQAMQQIEAMLGQQSAEANGEQVRPESGVARTVFDQSMQGVTGGFADEVQDRIGAGIASLWTGESYDDLLDEARGMSQERLTKQFEDRPALSIGSNIVGALATGGVGASTKAGSALANSLRAGSTGARIAKGFGAGATSGAVYGFGTASGGLENRLESAGEGAIFGGVTGGSLPAAGAALSSGLKGTKRAIQGAAARGEDALEESLDSIQNKASAAYQRMRDSGATINASASKKILNELNGALKASGPVNKRIHGDSLAVMKDLRSRLNKGDLGLEELDQYRQQFGDMAGNFTNKSNARTASILRSAIDDTLDELDESAFKVGSKEAHEALKIGRSEFARARKFEMISDIVKKSEGDANYVKRELKKVLHNPKKLRGFTKDEVGALKEAARLSPAEAALKVAGKFGFDASRLGSGVGAAFGSGFGGVAAGPAGAIAIPAVGTAARQGQKLLARGKAENLMQVIEKGGASGRKLPNLPSAPSGIAGGQVSQIESATNRAAQPRLAPMARDFVRDEAGTLSFGKNPKAAYQWMTDNLRGKSYKNTDSGLDIEVTPSGMKETLQYNRGNLDSLQRIPELLENSKIVERRPDKRFPNSNKLLVMHGELDGVPYEVQVKAVNPPHNKGNAKNKYHLHRLKRMVAPATGFGASSAYPVSPDATSDIKPQSSLKVNGFLDRVAMAESSGNPDAKAKTSSASGLFQFTDPTWKAVVRKYGAKHGIKMKDKNSPDAQRVMAQELADEHRAALQKALRREPTEGELYLAHFAGSGGAKRLLKAKSSVPAARVLPKAAAANRSIFYDGKRMRSVGEVVDLITSKV